MNNKFNRLIEEELSRQDRIDILKRDKGLYNVLKPGEFEDRILTQEVGRGDHCVFGVTPEGKRYAVIEVYEKYDDGDRWYEELSYYYIEEGDDGGKWIAKSLAKELMTQALEQYPELNKHSIPIEGT